MGRSPGLSLGAASLNQGGNPYGFPQQNTMWASSQAQQSPQHFPGYGPQQSPHIQQSPHQPPPQLRQQGSNPQMQPALQYPGMPGMTKGYSGPGRGMYPDQGSQQFMQPPTSGPPGPQGWTGQQPAGAGSTWGWSGQAQ